MQRAMNIFRFSLEIHNGPVQNLESDRVSADARAKETGSTFGRGRKRRGLSQREARSTKRAPWLVPFCLGHHNRT